MSDHGRAGEVEETGQSRSYGIQRGVYGVGEVLVRAPIRQYLQVPREDEEAPGLSEGLGQAPRDSSCGPRRLHHSLHTGGHGFTTTSSSSPGRRPAYRPAARAHHRFCGRGSQRTTPVLKIWGGDDP